MTLVQSTLVLGVGLPVIHIDVSHAADDVAEVLRRHNLGQPAKHLGGYRHVQAAQERARGGLDRREHAVLDHPLQVLVLVCLAHLAILGERARLIERIAVEAAALVRERAEEVDVVGQVEGVGCPARRRQGHAARAARADQSPGGGIDLPVVERLAGVADAAPVGGVRAFLGALGVLCLGCLCLPVLDGIRPVETEIELVDVIVAQEVDLGACKVGVEGLDLVVAGLPRLAVAQDELGPHRAQAQRNVLLVCQREA
mmetsp:Transcript_12753/g.53620  ORF Transcript_12753/g.53620 Transcript_12753/m.53620 type:complete len:256 (-) Transcript_12753:3234-4001(-)